MKRAYAYNCTFTLTSSSSLFEQVIGQRNAFYYNPAFSKAEKEKFNFRFDTDKIPWKEITPDYKLPENKFSFIIEKSPLSDIEGNDTTVREDLNLTWVSLSGTDDFTTDVGAYNVKLVDRLNKDKIFCEDSYQVLPIYGCKIDSITSSDGKDDLDSSWNIVVKDLVIRSDKDSSHAVYFETSKGRYPIKCDWYEAGFCTDLVPFSNDSIEYDIQNFDPGENWASVYSTSSNYMCGPYKFWVFNRDHTNIPSPTFIPSPSPVNPPICQACQRAFDPCADPRCQVSCNFCATPVPKNTPIPPLPDLTALCDQIDPKYQGDCHACVDPPKSNMWTAIGCLPTSGLESFLKDYLFVFGIGIAGGIAFLYFIYGSFLYLTSAGNAETVGQAKEIIISALSGLIFILLSIFFLKIIGADILRIPGFG